MNIKKLFMPMLSIIGVLSSANTNVVNVSEYVDFVNSVDENTPVVLVHNKDLVSEKNSTIFKMDNNENNQRLYHYSHRSHSSHYSHRSHYSSRY